MVVLSYGALVGIVIGSTVVGGAIAAWAISRIMGSFSN